MTKMFDNQVYWGIRDTEGKWISIDAYPETRYPEGCMKDETMARRFDSESEAYGEMQKYINRDFPISLSVAIVPPYETKTSIDDISELIDQD